MTGGLCLGLSWGFDELSLGVSEDEMTDGLGSTGLSDGFGFSEVEEEASSGGLGFLKVGLEIVEEAADGTTIPSVTGLVTVTDTTGKILGEVVVEAVCAGAKGGEFCSAGVAVDNSIAHPRSRTSAS